MHQPYLQDPIHLSAIMAIIISMCNREIGNTKNWDILRVIKVWGKKLVMSTSCDLHYFLKKTTTIEANGFKRQSFLRTIANVPWSAFVNGFIQFLPHCTLCIKWSRLKLKITFEQWRAESISKRRTICSRKENGCENFATFFNCFSSRKKVARIVRSLCVCDVSIRTERVWVNNRWKFQKIAKIEHIWEILSSYSHKVWFHRDVFVGRRGRGGRPEGQGQAEGRA